MKAVAVEEFKNRLSSCLREVKNGEILLVTDRGRVIAELRQPSMGVTLAAHDQALERLCSEGALLGGLPQDPRAYRASPLRHAVTSGDDLRRDQCGAEVAVEESRGRGSRPPRRRHL